RIPLFVKYPRQRKGAVDSRAARTVDVLPTIADVLGIRMPWHVDGNSLLGAPVPRRFVVVHQRDGPAVRSTLEVVQRQTRAPSHASSRRSGVVRSRSSRSE